MTLSSLMFEMLEMSSSVKPSAKYSSRGSEDMLVRGSTTIRCLSMWTGCCARASAFKFLDFGPDSQALSPTPLSSVTVLTSLMSGPLLQFKQGSRAGPACIWLYSRFLNHANFHSDKRVKWVLEIEDLGVEIWADHLAILLSRAIQLYPRYNHVGIRLRPPRKIRS